MTLLQSKSRLVLPLLAWMGSALIQPLNAQQACERLKQTLEYTQEEAPRDFTKVLSTVTAELNKVLDGVVEVDVEWNGSDLHGRVGEHIINCKVSRLAERIAPEVLQGLDVFTDDRGQQVISQCFQVPFTIYDTNECKLPEGHDMRHRCQEPSICVNTIGSYECMCPRLDGSLPPGIPVAEDGINLYSLDVAGEQEMDFFEDVLEEPRNRWEVSNNTASSSACRSRASTRGCCPENAHSRDGKDCRNQFSCPVDPCAPPKPSQKANPHECADNAQCVRAQSPHDDPDHTCACPKGLLGNGLKCLMIDAKPEPKVTFAGEPTEETIKANYCGCTKPTVDACAGFPPCRERHQVCVVSANDTPHCGCKKGFVKHETYGCVDERPPELKLNEDPYNDKTLRLKQGDVYKEHGVRIADANAEDYERMLKISYSAPVTHGCLTEVGEFHVNYTIKTPWTDPSSVVVTRRVIIEDIDECALDPAKFESTCPQLIPRCDTDAGATCKNTDGSYTCDCPKFTSGDGFLPNVAFPTGAAPEGFKGGTSCTDTSKPMIELKGPNPKIFRICPCGGISGIMNGKSTDNNLRDAQRQHYESDIKEMMKSTQGAELCATHDNMRPRPVNCISAYDETYKGLVDLSSRVEIGDPVQKSPLHWAVPYNVKDDAGNAATTVWRDVVVDEVDFESMEHKIREDVKKAHDIKLKNAVARAVEEERKRIESTGKQRNRRDMAIHTCPACPTCGEETSPKSVGSSDDRKIDVDECEKLCDARAGQCTANYSNFAIRIMIWMENWVAPEIASYILLGILLIGAGTLFRVLMLFLFKQGDFASNGDYIASDQERAIALQNSVTYYTSPQRQPQNQMSGPVGNTPGSGFGGATNGGPPRMSMSNSQPGSDFFFSPSHNSPHGDNSMPFGSPNSGNNNGGGMPFGSPPTMANGSTPLNSNSNYANSYEEHYLNTPSQNRMDQMTPGSDHLRQRRSPGSIFS
ncbi:latent transforming growth factor beta binding protein 2 [Seminavis robusta]|uniref:Latent transforming growth factor beta binding protein 2 n=1 Tax=Seminavis robusta TaxID=568900 RepID=A0A9N8HJK3_9STRA|nr:latent transforming growth factor beta binding protein 2 [Seminavis robusta]|eukprot:Sro696_g188850.1 latent transforming growth factor beta binding protein 2 (977) ;mRNA; r:12342-15617